MLLKGAVDLHLATAFLISSLAFLCNNGTALAVLL